MEHFIESFNILGNKFVIIQIKRFTIGLLPRGSMKYIHVGHIYTFLCVSMRSHAKICWFQTICQNCSALHAQRWRDERIRSSKFAQCWLANARFCEWNSPAPCTQTTNQCVQQCWRIMTVFFVYFEAHCQSNKMDLDSCLSPLDSLYSTAQIYSVTARDLGQDSSRCIVKFVLFSWVVKKAQKDCCWCSCCCCCCCLNSISVHGKLWKWYCEHLEQYICLCRFLFFVFA